ncbi:MAG: patatin-like phospholipase family protein [Vicinamibacterales bacterium]
MTPGSAPSDTPPLSWCDALEAEFLALRGEPALGDEAPRDPEARLRAVHARIHQQQPGTSALCLSGGGIRGATFALGVLQGLAHTGVLTHIDSLSTVSGGGYPGGWLTTWLHREAAAGRDEVMRELDPTTAAQTGALDDPSPVDRLRRT